jgi:hypothetical protein
MAPARRACSRSPSEDKRGRRFALASLLVKTEVGVADAWLREGMTKAEADALIAQIVAAAEAVEVSITLLERRLADALAINVARVHSSTRSVSLSGGLFFRKTRCVRILQCFSTAARSPSRCIGAKRRP